MTFSKGNSDLIHSATRILDCIGNKFGVEFKYNACAPAPSAKGGALLQDETIRTAQSAHAVLFASDEQSSLAEAAANKLAAALKLYTAADIARSYPLQANQMSGSGAAQNADYAIVSDASCGNLNLGYRNNKNLGRESFDEERYSELEIERVARIAYEFAETRRRKLTLVHMAHRLATSALWIKIVTDINEDYPFVSVDLMRADEACCNLTLHPSQFDTVLTSASIGGVLRGLAGAVSCGVIPTAYLGETALGMYGVKNIGLSKFENTALPSLEQTASAVGIARAVAMLLRHSLDMQSAADCIELAASQATAQVEHNNIKILSAIETTEIIISNLSSF